MLKIYIKTIVIITFGLFLFSCNRGELRNSEADILAVILPDSMKVGKPIITNTKIRIPKTAISKEDSILLEEQLKNLIPEFILTHGATISHEGVPRDFSTPQFYTVTSEDRKWNKIYEISFFISVFDKTEFKFSYFELSPGKKKYYIFYEIDDRLGTKQIVWDSGNSGFALTAKESTPAVDYPTSSIAMGKEGPGAKLVTSSTGSFGSLVGMPIAAGNLFLGFFDLSNATKKPLEATQFGVSTTMDEPKSLTLWCKYKAGPEYKDKDGNIISGMIDRPEVYAVLYEPYKDSDGNPVRLNGTNIKTSENIISMAVMSEEQVTQIRVNDILSDEYIKVTIPFVALKEFETEKQNSGSYYIALVFSSSAKGNLFEGAVGSTLCVDEVRFIK